jgi:peptidyl-prolyl cis-trans isomerase A (cyclophilin A)
MKLPARILGGLAVLALAATAVAVPGTDPTSKKKDVSLTALIVVGSPQIKDASGAATALTAGAPISSGSTITCDDSARAAVIINHYGSVDQGDVLLVGPGSEVHFARNARPESKTTLARSKPAVWTPVTVTVRDGTCRSFIRSPGGEATFALKSGDRTTYMTGADLGLSTDGAKEQYIVRSGSVVIHAGQRKLKLNAGLTRTIEGDRVLGAKQFAGDEWNAVVEGTAVPGLELKKKPAVARKAPQTPAAEKRPTPPSTASTDRTADRPGTPEPWEYDPVKNRYWNPDHGHWHSGRPPAGRGPTNAAAEPAATASNPASASAAEDYVFVSMMTSKGQIVLQLDRGRAPITVANFLGYVDAGFYDGTIFHRVMDNFMIQGGGFDVDLKKKKTRDGIKNEWRNGLTNDRGTIAMARYSGQPDSATSQFFINVKDNVALDRNRDGAAYAVFGKVVAGMDVIDQIRRVQTVVRGTHKNVPTEPVVIEKVERSTKEETLE